MTDSDSSATDGSISKRVARVEEIIERLESDEVSLEEARQLHEEGRELLGELEETFDLEEGSIIE